MYEQDVNIKNTYLYTYLGCNLDQHLNLESFLKDVIQRVNFKLFLFGKIRHYFIVTTGLLSRNETFNAVW